MNETEMRIANEKLGREIVKSVKKYDKAAFAYNYDCNMRPNAKRGDDKRHRLFWNKTNAFEHMMNLVRQIGKPTEPQKDSQQL